MCAHQHHLMPEATRANSMRAGRCPREGGSCLRAELGATGGRQAGPTPTKPGRQIELRRQNKSRCKRARRLQKLAESSFASRQARRVAGGRELDGWRASERAPRQARGNGATCQRRARSVELIRPDMAREQASSRQPLCALMARAQVAARTHEPLVACEAWPLFTHLGRSTRAGGRAGGGGTGAREISAPASRWPSLLAGQPAQFATPAAR